MARQVGVVKTWEHKGVAIHLGEAGNFWAVIDDQRVSCPSLSAIRARIDGTEKKRKEFKPFKALNEIWRWRNSDEGAAFEEITVTGIQKGRGRYGYNDFKFTTTSSTYGQDSVAVDTPANREAIQKAIAYRRETKRINDERTSVQDDLDNAIERISAKEYMLGPDHDKRSRR